MSGGETKMPAWLAEPTARLAAAFAAERFPHALLIHEDPGVGGDWLAAWAARLVLCQRRAQAPCEACNACRRAAALQHPDLVWLQATEDSRQIRIEQVRDLAADLALTSHAGGYKVGILSPADALNRFAANALLKTLEEPPPQTLLVLVSTQPSRLPPTVRSRCQQLRLRAPARAESVAWLTEARGPGDWNSALAVLGEAPMLAARAVPEDVVRIGSEVRGTLDALARGNADPVAAAESWARSELPLRLRCFENWLTEHVRYPEREGGFFTELPAPHLSAPEGFSNIRRLFGLIDEVRELRATLELPLNRGLALEALFRRLAPSPSAP